VDGAVILAGGSSSRMAATRLGWSSGTTAARACASDRRRALSADHRRGASRAGVAPLEHRAVERVDDAMADGGPLVGIVAGLARLSARGIERLCWLV